METRRYCNATPVLNFENQYWDLGCQQNLKRQMTYFVLWDFLFILVPCHLKKNRNSSATLADDGIKTKDVKVE